MTVRIWLILALVFASSLAANWYLWNSLSDARLVITTTTTKVTTLERSLEGFQARLDGISENITTLNQRSAEHGRRLQTALDQHPTWAAEPTPDPVADRLCDFLVCAPRP